MNCPSCGVAGDPAAAECAKCGLVFAKWRKREDDRVARQNAEAALGLQPTRSLKLPSKEAMRVGAVILAGLWLVFLGWFTYKHTNPKKHGPAKEGDYVELRDPNTGEIKRLKIERGATQKESVAVKPGAKGKEIDRSREADWVEDVPPPSR